MGEAENGSVGSGIPGIHFCMRKNESGGSALAKEGGEGSSSLWSYSSAFKPYGSLAVSSFSDRKEGESKSNKPNPFSPECSVPLPFQLGDDYGFYAIDSLWKRNERERHRVRCVNEGYERLRNHLPLRNKSKRISKVETLRLAIRYIKYLQDLLAENDRNIAPPNFEDISKSGD
ncbi:transcription factor Ash2 [Trichuris trichiura]|uniref:Transcription factor Ash2 n=1 Tax=Trichuris trichiura TaxID=36087 RepID=A0A077ZJ65_TRITR|nr:transcription factor Ash2 [Trichuris trichiura]